MQYIGHSCFGAIGYLKRLWRRVLVPSRLVQTKSPDGLLHTRRCYWKLFWIDMSEQCNLL